MVLFLCNFTKKPGTFQGKNTFVFPHKNPAILVKLHKNTTIGSHLFWSPLSGFFLGTMVLKRKISKPLDNACAVLF